MHPIVAGILIASLSSPSFPVRCAAYRELEGAGVSVAPYLLLCESSPDPEVRQRVRRLLVGCRVDTLSRLIDRHQPTPYLDSLPRTYPDHTGTVWRLVDAANQLPLDPRDPGRWPKYRLATRLWLAERLDAGDSVDDLARLLDVMAERSRYWDQHTKYPD